MEVAGASAAGATPADEWPSVVGGVVSEANPTEWLVVDAAVSLHCGAELVNCTLS